MVYCCRSGPEQLAMGTHSWRLDVLLQFLACSTGEPHIDKKKLVKVQEQMVLVLAQEELELEEEVQDRQTPPQVQSRRIWL